MPTTISIPEDLADSLYERKSRGESYADVITELLDKVEAAERAPTDTPAPQVEQVAEPVDDAPEPPEPATLDELIDNVASDVLPGSGSKLDARTEAFRAVVEHLQVEGTATPADFRREVYPDHPAHYTAGEDPSRSWWKNAMYPALAELADQSEEIETADQSGEWRFSGD